MPDAAPGVIRFTGGPADGETVAAPTWPPPPTVIVEEQVYVRTKWSQLDVPAEGVVRGGEYQWAPPSYGADLVRQERARQVIAEGYTPEDDDEWTSQELGQAAVAYITGQDRIWPWDPDLWKPAARDAAETVTASERISELVKAGALVVAEIDRLLRTMQQTSEPFAAGEVESTAEEVDDDDDAH